MKHKNNTGDVIFYKIFEHWDLNNFGQKMDKDQPPNAYQYQAPPGAVPFDGVHQPDIGKLLSFNAN